MNLGRVLATALVVALPALGWAGPATPGPDFAARLGSAVARGEVAPAAADLYRLAAAVDPSRLPAFLRGDGAGRARKGAEAAAANPHRCGTLAVRAVRAQHAELPATLRAEADALLGAARSAGRAASRTPGKAIVHQLANWAVTENFSIEWGPDLTNEDGSLPVRDVDANGVPDVVELWAAYFEASYREFVGPLGFSHPRLDENRVPVLIANTGGGAPNLGGSTYALTDFRPGAPVAEIQVNNSLAFAPPNGQGSFGLPKIHGAMKVTAAHELAHVVQFLYEPPAWVPSQDDWWLEASATWVEDEVFPRVDDYHQYFVQTGGRRGWADFVELGLPVPNHIAAPNGTARAYGAVIFAKYLSEHLSGRQGHRALWARIRGGERILPALGGHAADHGLVGGLPELYLGFAAANATMDYAEGANYGSAPLRGGVAHTGAAGQLPAYLGATYLAAGTPAPASPLGVRLTATPATPWGLSLVVHRAPGYQLALGALAPTGTAEVLVATLEADDEVYASPSFLSSGSPPSGYTTETFVLALSGSLPPAVPAVTSAQPAAGGFDLAWGAVPDAEGYVVRWRRDLESWAHRTIRAPVARAEVRGLAVGSYEIQVFAYDRRGNEGASGTVTVAVPQETVDTPTPAVPMTPGTGATGGGSGGGQGGGCFLGALGR